MKGTSTHKRYSWCLFLPLLVLLAACRLEADPPIVETRAEPDLLAFFPSATPSPVAAIQVTRLPQLTPSAEPTLTPSITPSPTTTPTQFPTATPIPTPTPTPCPEAGRIEKSTFVSRVQGPVRNYRIYLPPCYGQDGRVYPTLYILHGNIRGDEEWDVIGIDDSAETLIQSNEIPPMLIVMPDGRTISDISSGGDWSYEDIIINELLPHIESTYCAGNMREQRAIGGLSRGGYWAFQVAFRNTDLFQSAASHSGSFLDSSTDVLINPLYSVYEYDLSNLRLAMDYGGDDWSLETGRPLHFALEQLGVPHQWNAFATGGHDDPYWRTHVGNYLRWYAEPWSSVRADYATCD